MADAPYLIALALMEQEGKRALPISGKSQASTASDDVRNSEAESDTLPSQDAKSLALELLLRIWQRTDDGPLRRAAGSNSLLVVEIPMEHLPEDLPTLKAAWIQSGDSSAFLEGLRGIAVNGWTVVFTKYQPVCFEAW